jgi:hypothetical protein
MNRQTVSVELILCAEVTVTPEICEGIAEQYPQLWAEAQNDPEAIARAMLYASASRVTGGNEHYEDWWDGVGNMQGLIRNTRLEED